MFCRVLDFLSGLLRRYLPSHPNPSTREALVEADVQTPVQLSWLDKDAFDQFILDKRMETDEKILHEAGERLVLKILERLLQNRVDQDDFIINIDERKIKNSQLIISSSTDRSVFEFCMLDKDKTEKFYVGKQFTLVRRRGDESKEDRERGIRDEYKRVLREFHIWNKLRESNNFVPLLHISLDNGMSITAVSESFHRDVRQSLSTLGTDFVTIIKGIAKALSFLHKYTENISIDGLQNEGSSRVEEITGIAHSDVKCANVFLRKDSSIPYLADFGVSHQLINGTLTRTLVTSGVYAIGTLHWMPPEMLVAPDKKSESESKKIVKSGEGELKNNTQEIVSRNNPWEDTTKDLTEAVDVMKKITEAMKSNCLPKWPATISQPLQQYSDSLRNLRDLCCKYVPDNRLTMEEVVGRLEEIFVQ